MRFRNSTRLLTENFKNVYKILLYTLAVALVAIALSCTFLLPNLLEILDSMEMTAVVSDLKEFLRAIVSGNSEFLQGFQAQFNESVSALWRLLDSRMSQIVWSIVGCAAVYLLKRYVISLSAAFSMTECPPTRKRRLLPLISAISERPAFTASFTSPSFF